MLTGLVTFAGLSVQIKAQQEQLQTQIEEERETVRTDRRQAQYAEFLSHSASITAQLRTFEAEMLGLQVEDDVRRQVRAFRASGERIRRQIDRLRSEQTELLVAGPMTLAFVAWDIVDDQLVLLELTQFQYVLESLKTSPERLGVPVSADLSTVKGVKREIREVSDRLSANTWDLTVGVIFETGGDKAANPDAERVLRDRLNERRVPE